MKAKIILSSLLFIFSFLLLLAACPGNGGSSHSDGSTYVPGGGASSGTGGSSGGTSSSPADDILSKINTGDIETLVQLFSGGGGSSVFNESDTTRISFSASDIGLPSGGSVTLTLSSGSEEVTCTGTASSDGTVYVDIPTVKSGSTVTIRMDVRDSSGKLRLTGGGSMSVQGDDDSLDISLSDKVEIAITTDFPYLLFSGLVYDYDSGASFFITSESPSFMASLGHEISFSANAIQPDFNMYLLQLDWGNGPASGTHIIEEGDSLCLVRELLGSPPAVVPYTPDQYVGVYVDVDANAFGNWSVTFLEMTQPQLKYAMDHGLIEIVDTKLQKQGGAVGGFIDAADQGPITAPCTWRAGFKLKIGSVTSGEFFTSGQSWP